MGSKAHILILGVGLAAILFLNAVNSIDFTDDNFGADPGCKDPWTTEWTRDNQDCSKVHFCVQGKKYWTINCNDSRIWSNIGHACVTPMSQWDDCNQVMTTPMISEYTYVYT